MCGPRSLRIRMWMGICPPSKLCRVFEPVREPAPFWPRPEVLPVPEPSPRPMRLRALREPGAGLRVCRPIRGSSSASAIGDLHQVAHAVQHAARLLVVLDLDRVADAAQAERAQGRDLRLVGAVLRLDLRHLHAAGVSSGSEPAGSGSDSGSASGAAADSAGADSPSGSLVSPSTALTERPRSSATS